MSYLDYPESPEDMLDLHTERSAAISEARDIAYDYGYDEYEDGGDREAGAQRFAGQPRLMQDYRDGWDTAAGKEESR